MTQIISDISEKLNKAEQLINDEDYNSAKIILKEILKEDKSNFDALNNLVVVHIYENNILEALSLILDIIAVNPTDEIMVSNFTYLLNSFEQNEFDDLILQIISEKVQQGNNEEKRKHLPKVTLVQAPRWNINQPALAIAVLTGNLRTKNFKVNQHDFDVDFYRIVNNDDKKYWDDANENFWSHEEKVISLVEKYPVFKYYCLYNILINSPDVVGFSVQSKSRFLSLYFAENLKKINPEIYIVLGGPETSFGPEIMLVPYVFIDAIFIGEADISLPKFLNELNISTRSAGLVPGVVYRNIEGAIIDGGNVDKIPRIEDIALADFADIDFSKYRVPNSVNLIMSRGCINRCSFCNEAPIFKRYRSYKAHRAYNEICNIIKTTNIAGNPLISFNDSLINGHLKDLEEFCDLLIERPIEGLSFSGMMLVRKKMTDILIEKLAKAGLKEVFLGVETGSKVVLKIMNKNFELEDVERIVKKMYEVGIRVSIFFMVGHPGETEIEFYKSLNFMRKLANYASQFSVNITQILENSHINSNPDLYNVTELNAMNWISDNGTLTHEVRVQRQLISRMLLGDKAYGMGDFEDPSDPNSKDYYNQGRKLLTKNKEFADTINKLKNEYKIEMNFLLNRLNQSNNSFVNEVQ